MILKHSAEALTGEFSSSLATMPIHHSEAGIKAGTFKVVANHKLHTRETTKVRHIHSADLSQVDLKQGRPAERLSETVVIQNDFIRWNQFEWYHTQESYVRLSHFSMDAVRNCVIE